MFETLAGYLVPYEVTVRLDNVTRTGMRQVVCRMHDKDKQTVMQATKILGIKEAELLRMALIQVSRQVVASANVR